MCVHLKVSAVLLAEKQIGSSALATRTTVEVARKRRSGGALIVIVGMGIAALEIITVLVADVCPIKFVTVWQETRTEFT